MPSRETTTLIQVREARHDELVAVVELIKTAWADRVDPRSSGHRFTVDDLDYLVDVEGATTWVGVSGDDEIVGTVTVIRAVDDGSDEVTKLAVRADYRGSELSNELMRRVPFDSTLAVSLFQADLVRLYACMGYAVDYAVEYRHASPMSLPPIVMSRPGPDEDVIVEAAMVLDAGGLVGMPTETVYGLAADASNPVAVRSVFARKGRPVDHPLIVHIASGKHLETWAIATADAKALAAVFWPGPLTLVLPRQPHVLDEVTGGRNTVALRVPRHPLALAMIATLGEGAGVVAPSANKFGGVSPTSADHVCADGLCDYVLDGGPCTIGVESTILELVDGRAQLLRPGAVTAAQIESVIGRPVETTPTGPSRAPGMMGSHYAPRAAVMHVQVGDPIPDGWSNVAYFGPPGTCPSGAQELATVNPYTADTVAPLLYARLRDADSLTVDLLMVVNPDGGNLRVAVTDRLSRAAAPRPTPT